MIYIIQCLCGPNRHCIAAIAVDPANEPPAPSAAADLWSTLSEPAKVNCFRGALRWIVENELVGKTIDPWCGICGSRAWVYESGRTRFQTMEEAEPYIKQVAAANARTRQMFGKAGRN